MLASRAERSARAPSVCEQRAEWVRSRCAAAREYSKANVTVDCNDWKGSIVMTDEARVVDMSL